MPLFYIRPPLPLPNVRAGVVEGEDSRSVIKFAAMKFDLASTLYTDESRAYRVLGNVLPKHETVSRGTGEYARGPVHTNSIESVWAILKRSINGTWHHVSRKHLQRYVDEATFRLNEGNCEIDTIDRIKAIIAGMGGKRVPYRDLIS